MSQPPAFQFYARDFIADGRVAAMTNQERGIYITFLCYAWTEEGLPTSMRALATIARESQEVFEQAWVAIGPCFEEHEGRYYQGRMERVRTEQLEHSQKQSDKGRKGATTRWNAARERAAKAAALDSRGIARALPKDSPGDTQAVPDEMPGQCLDDSRKIALQTATAYTETSSLRTDFDETNNPSELDDQSLGEPVMPADLPATLPDDIRALKRLARIFLGAFANCHSAESQSKHGAAYTDVLASFRGRNLSTAQTWKAFSDALVANEGKPLFAASAKKALNHAPGFSRQASQGDAVPAVRKSRGWLRGDDGFFRPYEGVYMQEPIGFTDAKPNAEDLAPECRKAV